MQISDPQTISVAKLQWYKIVRIRSYRCSWNQVRNSRSIRFPGWHLVCSRACAALTCRLLTDGKTAVGLYVCCSLPDFFV